MRSFQHHPDPSASRKPTTVLLNQDLLDEAKALGIGVSSACERGLAAQIADVRAQRWLDENREAIASSNDFVEKNGLPLAGHRQF